MTDTPHRIPIAALAVLALLTACVDRPTPSPSVSTAATPTAVATPTPTPTPTATPSPSPTPTPLSLDPPAARDERAVALTVTPEVPADTGGRLVVTVRNASDTRVDEIVLRWPTELRATLVLAPFIPSEERIRDGGDPLVQPWTKWVEGPGERGEPAGTTSLGYGPLDGGATLTIPIYVTRAAPGPVSFDLQVLSGEALLTLEGGGPGEIRVTLP